jgi:hypothetical protein
VNKAQIKQKIGEEVFSRLDKEADTEVGLALQMPLVDQYRKEKWYYQRYLIPDLLEECELFEKLELKFSPMDIINVLFRCKLAFAVQTENDYYRRIPGHSYVDEYSFLIKWAEKANGIDSVIDQYLERMQDFISDKTLLAEISQFNYKSVDPNASPTEFFEQLFKKLSLPFVVFFDDDILLTKYKIADPHSRSHLLPDAKKYFLSPSIGFTSSGTSMYVQLYASAWLRTFLNMLRIGGFIYKPQIDFGWPEIGFSPPTTPVFLGSHSYGVWSWNEDAKMPWQKSPDGCLFLSFGYRGLSNMWLDARAYGGIEKFMLENKIIFDY